MRSTKHSMSALALGLAFALTGTMAAQSGKAALDGAIGMLNPCNNAIVVVPGSTDVNFHQNGNHVTVHVQFHNNGQDLQTQDPYRVNLEANQQFDKAADSYDVPFHSEWVAKASAPNFTMDGVMRVWVSNGTPTGSRLVQWQTACTNNAQ